MFPVRTAARPSIHCLGRLDDEATDNPLVGVFGPIGFGAAPIRRSGTDTPYLTALAPFSEQRSENTPDQRPTGAAANRSSHTFRHCFHHGIAPSGALTGGTGNRKLKCEMWIAEYANPQSLTYGMMSRFFGSGDCPAKYQMWLS
jgi:hypothetical protein